MICVAFSLITIIIFEKIKLSSCFYATQITITIAKVVIKVKI